MRNVSLAPSSGPVPLCDGVSNSIHAIEEAGRAPDEGRLKIEIKRSAPRLSFDPDVKPSQVDVDGFTVADIVTGLSEGNFKSFGMLESEDRVDTGGHPCELQGAALCNVRRQLETLSADSTAR